MNAIFDWCVEILVYFAGVFGIIYKEINVWSVDAAILHLLRNLFRLQ